MHAHNSSFHFSLLKYSHQSLLVIAAGLLLLLVLYVEKPFLPKMILLFCSSLCSALMLTGSWIISYVLLALISYGREADFFGSECCFATLLLIDLSRRLFIISSTSEPSVLPILLNHSTLTLSFTKSRSHHLLLKPYLWLTKVVSELMRSISFTSSW